MTLRYLTAVPEAQAVPISPLRKGDLDGWLAAQSEHVHRWVVATGFRAEAGNVCLIPDRQGSISRCLVGLGENEDIWSWAALPPKLPPVIYRIDAALTPTGADAAALGWALATYRFQRYRERSDSFATLVWPHGCDRATVETAAEATFMVRDLINTPAADMGPAELADAVTAEAGAFGAKVAVTVGDDLVANNYPAIHAIGRASARAPRLIDVTWGAADAPRVTFVGKGVCFDSGGLDIKTSQQMKLMKKDMGGAAIVLGLARMVMATALPVRLRLLIPAVENSISGNAIRPLDVVRTRKGLTVEIGNTDAEGRVILADALTEATADHPALLIDCATLTGAARVALGTELPAVFSNDDALVEDLLAHGRTVGDPLWRMPLWKPYRRHLDSKIADLTNAPDHPYAGAIFAALFLAEFAGTVPSWLHLDVMAWNLENRPGRPEGGEASGMRALYALVRDRFSN
jgi:leucyl aminopeptidase